MNRTGKKNPFEEEEDKFDFHEKSGKKFMNDTKSTSKPPEIVTKNNKSVFESNVKVESSGVRGFGEERSFAIKYRDNIRKIFDECSEKGEIEIPKLKGLLAEAG